LPDGIAYAFADLAPTAPVVSFAEPASMSSKREITPQGYLLIRDVVLARTGVQIYGPHEVPIEPGPVGYIEVERGEDELFSPETIASFEGVPVCNEHPKVNGVLSPLNPDNVLDFVAGTVQNVRRGEGDNSSFLIADVLLYSREIIDLVQTGKRQVSAGYDAVYFRIEAGRGKQGKIKGNHLAVVSSGRCGAVCSFADGELEMTTPTPAAPAAAAVVPRVPPVRRFGAPTSRASQLAARRLMAAVATGDEGYIAAEIDAAAAETEAPAVDPLDAIRASIEELRTQIAAMAEQKAAAEAAPAAAAEVAAEISEVAEAAAALAGEDLSDELVTDAAWREVISRAEVLSPGLTTPTGDAIATPVARKAAIVAHQRRALSMAYDAAPDAIRPIFGTAAKPDLDKMPGMAIRGYFLAASDKAAATRRAASLPAGFTADASGAALPAGVFGNPQQVPGLTPGAGKVPAPAAINARAAEVWAKRA
jgi:hypothetical protein